jgi:branched-chain amino acid transport system substrate-binding protein
MKCFFVYKLIGLLLLIIVCGCSPAKDKREFITIGALLPLTGEDSDEGLRALNGLMLAKREINESGGILGKMLDIIVLNDRGDVDYIVQQYNALKKRGVVAIIGSSYSKVTMALAKAAEADGIPIISPTASNPDVTKGRPNVFRATFIDDYQAEIMAHFAYDSLNARTALVLKNENHAAYKRISEIFIENFINLGGKILAIETYSSANDFPAILARHIVNKPDVIFCPDDFLPAARLINAIYEAGFGGTGILGSDAWDGILAYVSNPAAMKNVYYPAPFSFDDRDEEVVRFVRNYFSAFSQMPLSGAATAYTCVFILAEAIRIAGNTDKNHIVAAFRAIDMNVITGRIKFDENNNPRTNVYIIQIDGGVYSTYEKLSL